MNTRVTAGIFLLTTLTSCANELSSGMAPDRIVAERGGFVPEGIEYDNNRNRFLTGSFADGTIYEVTSSGRLVPAITSPDLIASIGIEVDESRDTLYVANSNMGIPNGAAELGIYNLATGEQLAMVDLAASIPDKPADASHFANDVAVSKAGVAYVTDSNMKIVYKVDKYYRASVLIDFGLDAEFGLNGIEYHPAGYLILASPGTGQLIRVPVDNPQRWELIDLDVPATGVDGIVWTADGSLVGVSNNRSRAVKYASDDNWRSARLTGMASYSGQSTTGAVVGNEIYVIQPHFSDDEPPEILRAKF
jgi:sugar lactone lactonase YvrE